MMCFPAALSELQSSGLRITKGLNDFSDLGERVT